MYRRTCKKNGMNLRLVPMEALQLFALYNENPRLVPLGGPAFVYVLYFTFFVRMQKCLYVRPDAPPSIPAIHRDA